MINKLKLIFLPFILVGVGFILAYSFLHWLLCIQYQLFELDDMIIGFLFPLLFLGILSSIFLKPRINLLKFKNNRNYFGYHALTAVLFIIPTMLTQNYLVKTTGKLTHLDAVSSITQHEKTKYYSISNYNFNAKEVSSYATTTVRGRANDKLDLSIYLTLPLYDSQADSNQSSNIWLGEKYFKTIDNDLSDHEKEKHFEAFTKEIQKKFFIKASKKFTYFDRIGSSSNLTNYQKAIKDNPKNQNANNIILEPETTPFEARAEQDLTWSLASLGIVLIFGFSILIFPRLDEEKVYAFSHHRAWVQKAAKEARMEAWKERISMLTPSQGYFVTPILIILNVVILFMSYSMESFLGNFHSSVTSLLRLFTNSFLHEGFHHLAINMVILMIIGTVIEPILGKLQLTLSYIVAALAGSLASLYFTDSVAIGASGAILGLYGVFLSLLMMTQIIPSEDKLDYFCAIGIFIPATFLTGFLFTHVTLAANLAGLFSGLLLGTLLALFETYTPLLPANRTSRIKEKYAFKNFK